MNPFVPEEALDYQEILRRGGANCGDEDFALFKCPNCCQIYLLEYEVDTVYLDPNDLTRRVDISHGAIPTFECNACGWRLPEVPLAGPRVPDEVRVTWEELEKSRWAWVAQRAAS
jgi:hypothetical protein